MPFVLEKVHDPHVGLAIWQRYTRLNLRATAAALLAGPPFTLTTVDDPNQAARQLCHSLTLFHWPLRADMRRLARRFSVLTGSPVVRIRLEHVTDDSCRKFHVDAVSLRLLCTYAGAGTEWIGGDLVHRIAPMDVAIFKGQAFPDAAPRVLHRSPPLSKGVFAGQSRLVLCIDTAS